MITTTTNDHETIVFAEKITKPNGEIEVRKYARGNFLGKGGSGKAYEVTEMATGKKMAGKIISKSFLEGTDFKQKLIAEVTAQKMLSHPRIVQLERAFEDRENIYILLELCSTQTLGDLLEKRQRLPESEVQRYITQLVEAMKHVHNKKIIHRDVKLKNLFLTDNMDLKLGDFGLSVKLNSFSEKRYTVCGTPAYIAPEILNKSGHSYHVDIWSIGVIMYQLLVGVSPFDNPNNKIVLKKISENNYCFPPEIPISPAAMDLISKILVLKPENRLSLEEILQHPFLKNTKLPLNKILKRAMIFTPTNKNGSSSKPTVTVQTPKINSSETKSKSSDNESADSKHYLQYRPGSAPKSPINGPMSNDSPLSRSLNAGFVGSASPVGIKVPTPTDAEAAKAHFDRNYVMVPQHLEHKDLEWADVPSSSKPSQSSQPYVTKWLDYASKYGIGYNLSDGTTGVIFNDHSKIVCHQHSKNFLYIEETSSDGNDKSFMYNFDRYPDHLERNVAIFKHFASYLDSNQSGVSIVSNISRHSYQNTQGGGGSPWNNSNEKYQPYVSKWTKTKHAIFFKLNTRIMQIVFKDGAVVVINPSTCSLEHISKSGEKTHHQLNGGIRIHDQEIVRKVEHVKETLHDIWRGKSATAV